jgi:hypothetical protein
MHEIVHLRQAFPAWISLLFEKSSKRNVSHGIFQHPVAFEVTHVYSLPSLMQLCFSWFL